MGTGLYPIGNHKIRFKEREFRELATEIMTVLNNNVFPNAEFLRLFALRWTSNGPRDIREIKSKHQWTFEEENEYYSFADTQEINLYGPFLLELTFDENKITF